MDLQKKHLIENNKICMIIGAFIQIVMVLGTIFYKNGRLFSTTPIVVIEVLSMAIMFFSYIKFKEEGLGRRLMMVSLAVSYLAVLIGSLHTPYFWAFGVLIGMVVVVYNDATVCRTACVAAVVINLIFVILYYATGSDAKFESTHMIPTNFGFVIAFAFICYIVARTNERQNNETMADIKRRAAEQEESAEKIRVTSEQIAAKLEEANEAMTSLSEKVHSSTEAVEQISSSVTMTAEAIQTQTEMNSNIMHSLEEISAESKDMQNLSNTVKGNVNDGNDIIAELTRQSEETAKVNGETAQMTRALAKSAETVKDIVSAILSISSQTNLLALNASIEAARAGEAGKGFAVVAEEIRKLSEDTKKSAEEIESTIEALISSVHSASKNMEKSVESSTKQGEMIQATGEKFEVILESVNALAMNVVKISDNVESCANATSTVMDSITDLSATSEEVAASSESSLTLSYECEKDMNATDKILGDILKLSRDR